jgi:hypothetical protein
LSAEVVPFLLVAPRCNPLFDLSVNLFLLIPVDEEFTPVDSLHELVFGEVPETFEDVLLEG